MSTPYEVLRAKMPLEHRERAQRRSRAMMAGIHLREKRLDLQLTQSEVAHRMDRSRSSVTRLEQRIDSHVHLLQEYVHALGGELSIVANFPDGDIRINEFDPPKRSRTPKR